MSKQTLTATDIKEIALDNEQEIKDILPTYENSVLDGLGLSPQEIMFIYYYIGNGFDLSDAYQRSFEMKDKYTAKQMGKKLLQRDRVKEGYRRMLDQVWKDAVTKLPHRVMAQYEAQLHFDVADYYDDSGQAIPLSEISKEKRKLIENVEHIFNSKTGATYVRYELPSREKALSSLFALLKLYKDMHGGDDKPTDSDTARKRDEIFRQIED